MSDETNRKAAYRFIAAELREARGAERGRLSPGVAAEVERIIAVMEAAAALPSLGEETNGVAG